MEHPQYLYDFPFRISGNFHAKISYLANKNLLQYGQMVPVVNILQVMLLKLYHQALLLLVFTGQLLHALNWMKMEEELKSIWLLASAFFATVVFCSFWVVLAPWWKKRRNPNNINLMPNELHTFCMMMEHFVIFLFVCVW